MLVLIFAGPVTDGHHMLSLPRPRSEGHGSDDGQARLAQLITDLGGAGPDDDGQRSLCLALLGVSGLERLTDQAGRRWAEQQLTLVDHELQAWCRSDLGVGCYRAGALTFGVVFAEADLEQGFDLATNLWQLIDRSTDSLDVVIGLAQWDGETTSSPLTLEIAADAALDHARSLGQPWTGPVVAAAPAGSGLRWLCAPARPVESLAGPSSP